MGVEVAALDRSPNTANHALLAVQTPRISFHGVQLQIWLLGLGQDGKLQPDWPIHFLSDELAVEQQLPGGGFRVVG